MPHHHILDFVGVNIEARDDDHVLLAVDNAGEAVRVDHRDITGLEPAFCIQCLGRCFGLLPVPLHDLRAFDAKLAPLAQRQFVAVIIDDLERSTRHGDAHRPQTRQLAVWVGAGYRRGFCQAVAFNDTAPGKVFPTLGGRFDQRCATRVGDLQRREVQLTETRVVHQCDKQGIEAQQGRETPLAQFLDEAGNIPRVGNQHVMVAGDHHAHAIRGEGIDVVQRQRRDHHFLAVLQQLLPIGAVLREAGQHLQHVGHQVAMGEHGALGQAGGAAGVLQHGDVIEVQRHRFGRQPAALAQHLLERHRLGQLVGRHHLLQLVDHGVDQPALGGRQQVAHLCLDQVLDTGIGQHLLHALAEHVQVHQRTRATVLELVAHLALGVQRIGIDHDQPGAHGTEYGDGVLQHIGHLHGNALTRFEVGVLLQPGSECCRMAFQFRVAEGHAQVAERRAVGKALAGALEHLDDRGVGIDVDGGRHACRALVIPEVGLHLLLFLCLDLHCVL